MLENGLKSTNCFVTQCLDLNIRFLRFPQTVLERNARVGPGVQSQSTQRRRNVKAMFLLWKRVKCFPSKVILDSFFKKTPRQGNQMIIVIPWFYIHTKT